MTPVFFLVVLLPLLAACLAGHGRARGLVWLALPWLPLPALLMAALVSDARVDVPWLLQGARWQIDALRVPFLAAAALLWSAAGLYARGYQSGDARAGLFLVCWCLCLAGNLWLILAGDAAGFYAGFALMTFAAWGLVVHARSARALQAGRVYISMALLGELAMLAGLLLASEAADGSMVLSDMAAAIPDAPHQGWIVALLVAGFGVKAGLPVLHFWLPLAHPVAPTPASAVLSGAMIKAGLLGWLFLLPLGLTELPGWGALLMALGLFAIFGAALRGLWEREAKSVLAWSSISQMGLATLLLGAVLVEPALWWQVSGWFGLFALHHGFAKGALFLSSGLPLPGGLRQRQAVLIVLALPALVLAGLPFSSGEEVKNLLTQALSGERAHGLPWAARLPALLTFSTFTTVLLLVRWWWLLRRQLHAGPASWTLWLGWAMLAALLCGLPLFHWGPV